MMMRTFPRPQSMSQGLAKSQNEIHFPASSSLSQCSAQIKVKVQLILRHFSAASRQLLVFRSAPDHPLCWVMLEV